MPEQRETIRLDIDDARALLAARRTNDQLERMEKKAGVTVGSLGRVADKIGDVTARTVERQRAAIERSLSSLEKRIASPGDLLAREQQQYLKLAGGNATHVERINKVFGTLRAEQEKVAVSSRGIADAIRNPLSAAAGAVEGFATKFGTLGVVAGGVALGLGAVAVSAFNLVRDVGAAAEQTVNLADRMGVAVGEAAVLEGQARLAGVSVGTLEGIIRKLSDTLTDNSVASRASVRELEKIGVSVVTSQGKFRDSISILREFSKHLNQIPEHAQQVQLATQVLGRGAVELLPLIKAYADLESQVKETGVGMDENLIRRMAEADDKLGKFGLRWDQLKLKMAEGIVGAIELVQKPTPGNYTGAWAKNILPWFADAAGAAGMMPKPSTSETVVSLPSPKEVAAERAGIAQGDQLLDKFRSRNPLAALQEQLTETERLRDEVQTKLVKGVSADAQRKSIAEFEKLDGQAKSLETRIDRIQKAEQSRLRELEENPRKLQQAIQAAAAELEKAASAQLDPLEQIQRRTSLAIEKLQAMGPGAQSGIDATLKASEIEVAAIFEGYAKEHQEATARRLEEEKKTRIQMETAVAAEIKQTNERIAQGQRELGQEGFRLQQQTIEARVESERRGLELVGAVSVEEKLALEQKRLAIDIQYYRDRLAIQRDALDAEYKAEEAGLFARGASYAEFELLEANHQAKRKALHLSADSEIAAARDETTIRSNQLIADANADALKKQTDANQKALDTLQRQAEGVFDAMVRTWRDGWSGAADFMKTVLLTALKSVVTSQIVRMLSGLGFGGGATGGGQVAFAGGFGGGWRGILSSVMGLGGLSAAPGFGASGQLGPGGTAPFVGGNPFSLYPGPGQASHAGGIAQATQAAGIVGNLKDTLATYKGYLTQLGNLGGKAGIHGAKGGGMLLGGGILALDGLRRGGLLGLAETTGGGALIGAKFGGPVGAAIGAGIGFVAGLFGLFRTSAEEKIVKKVREIYGFDIEKSFAKNSLLPLIKQSFGGDIDAGLRSPQVRELIELYAMSRGLSTQGIVARATPSVFASRGGAFQQMPTFQNGTPITAGVPGSSQSVSQTVVVQMDGPTTERFLQGQQAKALAANPRGVSRSAEAGNRARGGRSVMAAQMAPTFLT